MQITAPAPIIYLPENLWSLFTRPGRELLIRVLNVEGKTLYLELGGDRFQARIGGTINPEDFRPGMTIRVRVVRVGHPIVLQLVPEEGREVESKDLTLFYLVRDTGQSQSQEVFFKKDLDLLATFVKEFIPTIEKENKVEKKEEVFKKLFGDKIKALRIMYQHNKLIIPFLFYDDRSWGFLELEPPKKEGDRIRVFYLKLYFEYLGLVECYIGYSEKEVYLDLYFANKEAYEMARKEYVSLEKLLAVDKRRARISINTQEVLPGYILEKQG
ncbi:MAG: hypothetical protein GXO57_00630 [Thermodesulfobacteria bacterium]|nr:hypothetical protein [Thermodesulfobacteriota bacterium]